LSISPTNGSTAVSKLEAWHIARYQTGGPPPAPGALQSEIGRSFAAHLAEANGHDRDLVVDGWLETLSSDDARSAKAAISAADPEGEPPSAPRAEATKTAAWPVLNEDALCGLPGDIVKAIDPCTEADRVAVLMNALAMFGNAAGRTPHALVGGGRHGTNLFIATVGRSGSGRKGVATTEVKALMEQVDPEWSANCVASGLSSGEGLIYAVRDPSDVLNKDGLPVDPGVMDKRLLSIETEFASVLRVMTRDGNTVSARIRDAWDGVILRTLTRQSPLTATGAHVGIIGHVTLDDLLKYLTATEAGNGFGNRFLWACVKRSKELPENEQGPSYKEIVPRLRDALEFAWRQHEPIRRDEAAREMWGQAYGRLTAERPGLYGAVTGRGEAQTLRLSLVYALLDQSAVVRADHLKAALAIWQYAQDSAAYIFGNLRGDSVADRILEGLQGAGAQGLTKNEVRDLFSRHVAASRTDTALRSLELANLIAMKTVATAGRPSEVYVAR